jgi:uncharacterized iron-regulated membrane protein
MANLETPLQIAMVASILAWPLLAGVGLVFWSKARAAAHARRVTHMETQLQGMYRTMEAKPIPQRLAMVVDALQEGEELAAADKRAGRKLATSARS